MDAAHQSEMQHHMEGMRAQHQQLLWVHFGVVLLGIWLLTSPVTFGMPQVGELPVRVAEVTRSRGLQPIAERLQWMAWSDMASGVAMIVFGSLSLWFRQRWAQWGTCAVGLWPVFWHGGVVQGGSTDDSPPLEMNKGRWRALHEQAMALPLALLVSASIGIWLMFTRLSLGHTGAMADSDHLVGSLVFTVSVCAFAEVVRPMRLANGLFGAWLLIAPWVLEGATPTGAVAVMVAGAALIGLALPRGPVRHQYGRWNAALRW